MIALFSLWGRFALRNRLAKSVIVDCNAELSSYLCNNTIEIIDYEQLNDRSWLLVYKDKEDHVVENDTSNPILALWLVIHMHIGKKIGFRTTSAARLHLLKGIYTVLEGREDSSVLYMDTDSIIYEFNEELGDPMAELAGEHLGAWKDEYPDHNILEYVSAGAKAYALWLRHKTTGKDKFMMRLKSITLDYRYSLRKTFIAIDLAFQNIRDLGLYPIPGTMLAVWRSGQCRSAAL